MKKKYEKPFIMKLEISSTNGVNSSGDPCTQYGEPGGEEFEFWTRKTDGSGIKCMDVVYYSHVMD